MSIQPLTTHSLPQVSPTSFHNNHFDPSPHQQPIASTSKTTEADTLPKPRTSRACSSCNRQKLRCDGAHPCVRCVSLKIIDSCEYLPSLRGKTRKRKSKVDGEDDEQPHRARSLDRAGREDQVDSRLSMWKRDNSFQEYGPTNTALWGQGHPPLNQHLPSFSASPAQPSPTTGHLTEKLTTLPLPGDAHNPLAVLAEASATAHSDHDVTSPHVMMPSKEVKAEEAGGYYMPLERVLKDEAPHIMSYIKVHE